MRKVFVLDTNVLLANPHGVFKFEDNDVVIPISVIEEIDTFKKDQSDIGRNARETSRVLDQLRSHGTLAEGVKLFPDRQESGQLFVYLSQDMTVLPELLNNNVDNHILAIGLNLQKKYGQDKKVVIITRDTNLRIKADAFGLEAEDFEADSIKVDEQYTGVVTVGIPAAAINDFYVSREMKIEDHDFYPNQFVILEDIEDSSQFVYGVYDGLDQVIRMLEPSTDGVWGIFPRNIEQTFALEALLDDAIQLVTISGAAGTGKTLLAIAAGLVKTTDEDIYNKLLVSRPIFPLGRDIGYLPGDMDEKLNPWMQPIFDNLELLLGGHSHQRGKRMMGKSYQELLNQGMLAVEPLTYIRGRSIPNQYFVVDESQNLTPHEIKTILTRAGEGTKIVLTGDPYQIDNPYLDSLNNGLTYVIERFKGDKLATHITLQKGERSELASKAAKLL